MPQNPILKAHLEGVEERDCPTPPGQEWNGKHKYDKNGFCILCGNTKEQNSHSAINEGIKEIRKGDV